MAPRHQGLGDLVLGRAQALFGVENLFLGRDVVARAGEEIDGARDVAEREPPAETDEAALEQAVFLEELGDDLKVPSARQVDRRFVPPLEGLELARVLRIVDVLVECEVLVDVLLVGVHALEPGEHVVAAKNPAAALHQALEEGEG